ncbi:MAG: hypothetical protein JWO26_1978 [Rhodospirillales bacterium]|nr:hypothetical protein [Rhodospirillales bacterium]
MPEVVRFGHHSQEVLEPAEAPDILRRATALTCQQDRSVLAGQQRDLALCLDEVLPMVAEVVEVG